MFGPAFGRRREADAVGAVLLFAQAVTRAEPGDHPSRGQALECEELRRQHRVGHQADAGHQGAEEGAAARAVGRLEHGGQRAEEREGRQGRPLGLADGPDVVVTEQAVDAGRDRGRGGGEGRVGRVAEGRQHDAGPHQPKPPCRTASAPPTAPARSPKAAGTITAGGRRSPPSTSSA